MPDYFRVAYLHFTPSGSPAPLSEPALDVWRCMWSESPYVRWRAAKAATLDTDLQGVGLAVIEWAHDREQAKRREELLDLIRHRPTPVLVLASGSLPGRNPVLENIGRHPRVRVLAPAQACDPDLVKNALHELGAVPPAPRLDLQWAPHPVLDRLVNVIGKAPLQLRICRFFPKATQAYLEPVQGGWSGAPLCQAVIDGNDDERYFLKFFNDLGKFLEELQRHRQARSWLKKTQVNLRSIPGRKGYFEDHLPASEIAGPHPYAVCYESAKSADFPRKTLQEMYHAAGAEALKGAFEQLLVVLAKNQRPIGRKPRSEPPWSREPERGFWLGEEDIRAVRSMIDELSIYGPKMYKSEEKWQGAADRIRAFISAPPLPTWLSDSCRVVRGRVHGDPNARNCLVLPTDVSNLRLIDCGGYEPNGRRVSDLAYIERDLKLLLLSTEENAGGYFDLDVRCFPAWLQAERDSIRKGIAYEPDDAPTASDRIHGSASVHRAYRLIGIVRQNAKEICRDKDGKHYFAALLYRTLRMLNYPPIQPTKKLLALYSAAEILRVFEEKVKKT